VVSVLIWGLAFVLFVVGAIFCFMAPLRSKGRQMLLGSFLVWCLSVGMCAVATTTTNLQAPVSKTSLNATTVPQNVPQKDLPAAPPLEAGRTPEPSSTPPAPPPAPPPSKGKWTGGSEGPSVMDDTETIAYRLQAENEIAGWLAQHRPHLVVRCQERKTEAMVEVGMASQPELGSYQRHTVRLRFDDAPAASQLWSDSTNNEALFSPSGVALARRLAKTKRFRLQFTPFNANPQIIEFDTTGFDQVIAEIARPCGWKP
jgi:hypothetical protein